MANRLNALAPEIIEWALGTGDLRWIEDDNGQPTLYSPLGEDAVSEIRNRHTQMMTAPNAAGWSPFINTNLSAGITEAGSLPEALQTHPEIFNAGNTMTDPTGRAYMSPEAQAAINEKMAATRASDFVGLKYLAAPMAFTGLANLAGLAGTVEGVAGAAGAGAAPPASYWSALAGEAPAGGISALGGGMSAADIAGLTQMGQAAGLSGEALASFVSSGGTLGSTAAGGLGGMTLAESFGLPTPGYTPPTYGPSMPQLPKLPPTPPGGNSGSGLPHTEYSESWASPNGMVPPNVGGPNFTGLPNWLASALGLANTGAQAAGGLFPNATAGSLLEGLLKGGLGYIGANQQADALRDTTNQWLQLGAPSRARYEASFAPDFDIFTADPAARSAATRAADIAARSYSASAGNPFDNPGSQAGIYDSVLRGVALPATQQYRSLNLTGGQLGTNTAGTSSLAEASQAGSGLNAIGYGVGTALSPPTGLEQLLKQYKLVM